MTPTLSKIDWRKSSAHLLLLSKFLQPRSIVDFTKGDSWNSVLRESPQQAIKHFVDDGTLVRSDLSEHVSYKFKVTELKNLLKQRGLSISGRKEEMINRLIQADCDGMKKAVDDLNLLQCSEQGSKIVEDYLNDEKGKRAKAEQQVMSALKKHSFQEASRLVANFEAEQVFPRGINMDWGNYDTSHNVLILNNIFGYLPKQLANLGSELIERFRVVAGMVYLWGTGNGKEWNMSNEATGLAFDSNAVVRLLISHGIYRQEIAEYKRIGVKKIRILTCNDTTVCDVCQKLASKTYKISEIPELPYEKCTCEFGCRCSISIDEF